MKHEQLPDITTDFARWYHEIVYRAELADQAPVRGCMVMRPYGCALWEHITQILNGKIKATGHQNALFPLLIPKSFLDREANHVAGFSPELAVVTHAGGKELEEPLVVRPTSETIIHAMFARWIRSWRDLPLKINQWASVVRWEMRSRPFLRTTEFWWQEGHTAHETEQEAHEEVYTMLEQYRDLIESYLAIPVVAGMKSEQEKFAGADFTMTLEGMMPDGKALQMCTSHSISQSFARAFEMKFQDRAGNLAYPYLTSWGATTRLIGALIMTHGDQKGLIIPPRVAPIQIVIIPIIKQENKAEVFAAAQQIADQLQGAFRINVDLDTEKTPGAKFYEAELKGIPLRIELGGREVAQKTAIVVDRLTGSKQSCSHDQLVSYCREQLEHLQQRLFEQAKERRAQQWHSATTFAELTEGLGACSAEAESVVSASIERHRQAVKRGFFQVSWCGMKECEASLGDLKASIRCLLTEAPVGNCFRCGMIGKKTALVARSY